MRNRFMRKPGSDFGIDQYVKAERPTCMTTKASANASPLLSNALGMDVESSRPAIIRPNSITRMGVRSGSSQLVIQDV